MGFFSWITQDTKRSISNRYSSRPPFPVTMTDNRGNRWHETGYDGYGVFGGKPYYELLAEMNGLPPDFDTGVDLAYSTQPHITPNLTEDPEWAWRDEAPESCPGQGVFYDVERLLDQ